MLDPPEPHESPPEESVFPSFSRGFGSPLPGGSLFASRTDFLTTTMLFAVNSKLSPVPRRISASASRGALVPDTPFVFADPTSASVKINCRFRLRRERLQRGRHRLRLDLVGLRRRIGRVGSRGRQAYEPCGHGHLQCLLALLVHEHPPIAVFFLASCPRKKEGPCVYGQPRCPTPQ